MSVCVRERKFQRINARRSIDARRRIYIAPRASVNNDKNPNFRRHTAAVASRHGGKAGRGERKPRFGSASRQASFSRRPSRIARDNRNAESQKRNFLDSRAEDRDRLFASRGDAGSRRGADPNRRRDEGPPCSAAV